MNPIRSRSQFGGFERPEALELCGGHEETKEGREPILRRRRIGQELAVEVVAVDQLLQAAVEECDRDESTQGRDGEFALFVQRLVKQCHDPEAQEFQENVIGRDRHGPGNL